MSPEKTQQLFDRFPRLFRGKDKPTSETLMSLGVACNGGWFTLLVALASRLEAIARAEGRDPLSDDWPEALQVKEKLGRLCFYVRHGSPAMLEAIAETSALSETTCEVCGQPDARPVGNRARCSRHG